MTLKKLFILCIFVIFVASCDKKTETNDAKPSKANTSKAEEILNSLKAPKVGFKCELEELESGKITNIFYRDTSKETKDEDNVLKHRVYTLNDKESVEAGITVLDRKILWLINYTSEEDSMYYASVLTSESNDDKMEKEEVLYSTISVNAIILFDSKINEFTINLVFDKIDEGGNRATLDHEAAIISNCHKASVVIPLGL